jgi:homogentisate 1,2-dioxygenase
MMSPHGTECIIPISMILVVTILLTLFPMTRIRVSSPYSQLRLIIKGTEVADFVIFPPRLVAEDTYRHLEFHRNTMSELMGLIDGIYDSEEQGFCHVGASLHNIMSGHGLDEKVHRQASNENLNLVKVGECSMTFTFESYFMVGVMHWGLHKCKKIQLSYSESSWRSLKVHFDLTVNFRTD